MQRLTLVIVAYARGGGFERLTLNGRQARQCFLEFVLREFKLGHRRGIEAVEAIGVFDHRRIAARLYIGQNGGDGLVDGGILRTLKGQQRIETRLEIGVGTRETFNADHASTTRVMASRIGASVSRLSLSAA